MPEPEPTQVVPFGKYKGQPVEVLAADRSYCDWLSTQPWFSSRYSNLALIINNFGEPAETPEHNKLQAMALDREFCWKVVLSYHATARSSAEYLTNDVDHAKEFLEKHFPWQHLEPAPVNSDHWADSGRHKREIESFEKIYFSIGANSYMEREFEPEGGGDVFLEWQIGLDTSFRPHDLVTCRDPDLFGKSDRERGDRQMSFYDCARRLAASDPSWRMFFHVYGRVLLEMKPTLADDYPAVLRQARRISRDHMRTVVVVIGEYTGVGATLEQVRAIFDPTQILTVDEIESVQLPPVVWTIP